MWWYYIWMDESRNEDFLIQCKLGAQLIEINKYCHIFTKYT